MILHTMAAKDDPQDPSTVCEPEERVLVWHWLLRGDLRHRAGIWDPGLLDYWTIGIQGYRAMASRAIGLHDSFYRSLALAPI